MLSRQVFDSTQLPAAVWQHFFHNCELYYQNDLYQSTKVNLKSGGEIKKLTIGHYTYLEQNPHSTSEWGRMARLGHKILWIIHYPTQRYVGRVVDGKVTQIR
jgi:hypothetical protein